MKKTAVLALVLLGIFAVSVFAVKPVAALYKVKAGSITVDGKISDWKALGIEPIAINTEAQVAIGKPYWLGAAKQSGKIYVAFDDKNIYVCAVVTNPKGALNKYTGGDIYQGTGIEVFIGFDNSNPDREMYTETDYQVGISTGQYSKPSGSFKVKPQAFIYNTKKAFKDAVIKCKPTATGYILEASLPASGLQGFDIQDGQEIGFELGIDDVGAKGVIRQVQLTWTGDKDGWQFPKGWGKAVIKAK
jgi:hypothetical protein